MAIIAWKSPITSYVSITGGVSDDDPGGGDGILWYIDQNSTNLAAGSYPNGGAQTFANGTGGSYLSSVAVQKGDVIYFLVNPNQNYYYNSTRIDISIQALPQQTPTSPVTPTPTYTPGVPDPRWGTGADGDLTIASGAYNINTQNQSGRSCADGGDAVAYSVASLGSTEATLSTAPSTGCLNAGDEVLLVNMLGTNTNYTNTGNYEFLHVSSVSGNQVNFTASKVNWYGDGWRDDSNIGTGAGQQVVMLMRVPNYHNVTINGTLTANAWNGNIYGVVAFRVSGTLTGGGIISATALGYLQSGGYVAGGQYQYGAGQNAPSSSGGNLLGGGGGYGSNGANGAVSGGLAYGDPNLNQIFLGGGGGKGGDCKNDCGDNYGGGPGDPGGGILFMAGQTINFTGSLLSNGGNVAYWGGAGGAGGSILVEGNNVTLSNASAVTGNGAAAGGVGRIAVYYEGNLTQGTINPAASTTVLGQAATATPTATPILNVTPTATRSNYYGSGVDGDLTVASGATYNINTNNNSSRSCADGIAYNVTGLTNSTAILSTTPANGCLAAGDEVLLINLQGTNTNYSNTGNYEFLHVGGTVGNAVYFTTPKIHFYGTNATDDSNIGTGAGQQVVMLMRVPNYHNVTINGTLTANAWNGNIYGVVAFRVSGTLTGGGIISATALGYLQSGGYVAGGQYQYGAGQNAPSSSGGNLLGGGGGYGSNGANGAVSGGLAYGDPNLNQIFLGGGGGKGGDCKNDCGDNYGGGPGDPGGGILFMAGQTINFTGSLLSNGGNVAYWGGRRRSWREHLGRR